MNENINRKCPICEDLISYSDFYRTNFNRNVDLGNEGIFFDERVGISCCRCLEIIEKLSNAAIIECFQNPNQELYHIKIKRDTIFEDTEIITIFKETILKNLIKFGIIE